MEGALGFKRTWVKWGAYLLRVTSGPVTILRLNNEDISERSMYFVSQSIGRLIRRVNKFIFLRYSEIIS